VQLVDYSARPSSGPEVKGAGYDGAIRYLANDPERLPNKRLTPDEARSFLDLGMPLVSNWQRTKEDWHRGFAGGASDAEEGLRWHYACAGPGFRPIYFSIDSDINLDQWNAQALPYLDGAASVLGREWIGVYGGQRTMWWAAEDGFGWRWQTRAWSLYDEAGNWHSDWPTQWVPGCQLRQERIDQDHINDLGIDVNTTWADDFGQWQAAGGGEDDTAVWAAILAQQVGAT
jgi:hypothetical protein